MNKDKNLIPKKDEQSQFDEHMHIDDYIKILLNVAYTHSSSKSSYSSPETSVESLDKMSGVITVQKSKESLHSNPKNSKDSSTKSFKMYFLRHKLENADELKSQGKIYYMSGNYKESLEYLSHDEELQADIDKLLQLEHKKKYEDSLKNMKSSLGIDNVTKFENST
ncbi:12501_t:CDS:2 [Cetraspora pellucida]|uniref:12501_t:CDS:1 n=1 Tax=Cetraspora pellucida TaxID=1433469 RepID=A0A9N8Z157_9GLOM|nr:12501_t:CDS:2 [Cetraspora pellucida]